MTHCIIMHIYNTVRHKCQRVENGICPQETRLQSKTALELSHATDEINDHGSNRHVLAGIPPGFDCIGSSNRAFHGSAG